MEQKIFTKEEIRKKLESLPAEIKNMLYSSETDNIIQKIGTKHQLHIDQLGMLLAEVNDVMTGLTGTQDFPLSLVDSLQIDRIKADAIAQDVNDMLFVKIRDAMKKVYEENKAAPIPLEARSAQAAVPSGLPLTGQGPKPPLSSALPITPKPAGQSPLGAAPPATAPSGVPPKAVTTPPLAPSMHQAEVMLTEKTVQTPEPLGRSPATGEAPKPQSYKTDPYREPPA